MRPTFLNPKHWLYIACNAIVIILGFLLCKAAPNTIWFAAGGSLVAAGLSGWIVFVYVWATGSVSDKLELLAKFGLIKAFEARSVVIKEEYVQRLKGAREQIDLIGFGLSALREDFLGDFPKWKQNTKVRILLLDPEFPNEDVCYANQRDFEENNAGGKIASDVRKFVFDVRHLISGNASPFEVRLYRCLPTLNIFRIDDELFWGPYLVNEQSRNSPTFLVERGGILFDRFSRQFDQIWQNDQLSRAVPREWIEGSV